MGCHEVRCLELPKDEFARVSFRDLTNLKTKEEFVSLKPPGVPSESCILRSLSLDSVVRVRVWGFRKGGPVESAERRVYGEVRIPMHFLVSSCGSALYYCWLALDEPGLSDSVASIGSILGGGDSDAFKVSMTNGPRLLSQLKTCVSLCKVSDMMGGEFLLRETASSDEKVSQWVPLLRSHQQHRLMSEVQHLRLCQLSGTNQSQELEVLEDRIRQQDEQMRDMQRHLDQGELAKENEQLRAEIASVVHRGGTDSRAEVTRLQTELESTVANANAKIDAANERIRNLRHDKDEAVREVERLTMQAQRVLDERNELEMENQKLCEQKEALLKIVEDLHRTCEGAGLSMGRRSIEDSFLMR